MPSKTSRRVLLPLLLASCAKPSADPAPSAQRDPTPTVASEQRVPTTTTPPTLPKPKATRPAAPKRFFYGFVTSESKPVPGARVTFYHGIKVHSLTVFTDDKGRYLTPQMPFSTGYSARVRRVGWKDATRADLTITPRLGTRLSVELERHSSEFDTAAQLPANHWMKLILDQLDEAEQKEFTQQCTYCHQQGSAVTRRDRPQAQWQEVIRQMELRGAIISHKLRDKLPVAYIRAYGLEAELPSRALYQDKHGPLPVPSKTARRAVIEEWQLGGVDSSQHDMMFYDPDNTVWSVDGPLDSLRKIDINTNPDGDRTAYAIPRGTLDVGGVYRKMKVVPGRVDTYLSPHSLQTAPDGRIWLTLASGNKLAGFDPRTESWEMVDLEEGLNPHTLRFDGEGRLWYTITATNHVGMFDPVSKQQKFIRLPSPDWSTAAVVRITPFLVAHADWFDLSERGADSDGVSVPMPYGIDVPPIDGSIWYSQLNYSHIGRIDPETLDVTPIETPFVTPRRLRFDSKGALWIPSYSEASVFRYDTRTNTFEGWKLPITPAGTATPYALAIEPGTDHVWINGTQSDTMIRFEPDTETFTVYPMPTLLTYTRDIDFDNEHRIWTSHSNFPASHMEGGKPHVSRIDPDGAPGIEQSGVFATVDAGVDGDGDGAPARR